MTMGSKNKSALRKKAASYNSLYDQVIPSFDFLDDCDLGRIRIHNVVDIVNFDLLINIIISKIENKKGIKPNGLEIDKTMFKVDTSFAVGALIVCAILIALYSLFW